MSEIIKKSSYKSFGGNTSFYKHQSEACKCEMGFSIYLPSKSKDTPVPVLYWLSGLTCTEENFMIKAGAQQFAEKYGIAIVAPDTSPRGLNLPKEDEHWDFGSGAGFYLNATQDPWSNNYNMADYIVKELPGIIESNFPVIKEKKSISGHSMGGHGALTIALNNPNIYKSVSAFAPISSPINCPWGVKAFSNYLGSDKSKWEEYDSAYLIKSSVEKFPILVDQGTSDNFLEEQLKPEFLIKAAKENDFPLELRMQEGYDHSFYFIASFIGDHIKYHSEVLN